MTEWAYTQIDTHDADARARYTSQYASADNLKALTTLWAERVQGLEDAAWTVLTDRWLDDAEGQQLDELGAVVGEPRLGRTDENYRVAIGVRISVNQSGGEPERIIDFLIWIAGADNVLYQEIWPAKIEIFVNGEVSFTQAQRVKKLVPAGVGTIYITEAGDNLPFGTKDGPSDTPTEVDGLGELGFQMFAGDDVIETDDGGIIGGNDLQEPVLPTEGGYLAELYEV